MKKLSFAPTDNKQHIYDLAEKIRANDVVFFAGAALSMTCGLPLAADFKLAVIEALAQVIKERAHQDLTEEDDVWLTISTGQLGERWWSIPLEVMFQFIVNTTGRRGLEPFSVLEIGNDMYCHNHLFLALGGGRYFNKVITTNQDRLIENACNALSLSHNSIYSEREMPNAKAANIVDLQIIKLHGTVEDLQSLVVTIDQAGAKLSPRKEEVLTSCLIENTVCFVGYGLGDYDIYSTIMNTNAKEPYALLKPRNPKQSLDNYVKENQRILDVLSKNNGTPIVCDIDEFFEELCTSLIPIQHKEHKGSLSGRGKHLKVTANKREVVIALLGESMGYKRQGMYGKAWRVASKSLKIAAKTNDRILLAESLFHSGSALRQKAGGFSLRGLLRLRKAESIYSKLDGISAKHGKGSAMLSIALVWRNLVPRLGIFDKFRERILLRLKDAYALLNGPNGNAKRIIADVHRELGQIDQAITAVEQAELICKWHKDDVGLANTMRTKARIHLSEGNLHSSEKDYFYALRASRRTADQPGTIKALIGLASTNAALARRSRAALLYKLAMNQILDTGVSNINIGILIKVIAGTIRTSVAWPSSRTSKRQSESDSSGRKEGI
jgi:tetratricopeptide (TPR) repeat protein